ncbi:MAG: class I SAM-dependent methyltransferase [Thermoanaerobaculales bacterium]|jgi:hypothetical protein|nr:class I SAM-dependent methyltransferase [Thermoanaerobaculales bacterium]
MEPRLRIDWNGILGPSTLDGVDGGGTPARPNGKEPQLSLENPARNGNERRTGPLARAAGWLLRRSLVERVLVRLVALLPAESLTRERYFGLFERRGFHITPVRFDQPIPDTAELDEAIWSRSSALVGVDLRVDRQVELLSEMASEFKQEYDAFPDDEPGDPVAFFFDQHSFRSCDPEILYCMIRHFQPKRMIEIGSGMSTLVAMAASRKNREHHGRGCRITAIEPYPRPFLLGDLPELDELVQERVETVDMGRFAELEAGDILFIDSSHVVRTGGDVVYEFLEVIPRLNSGVLVHVHDIFLPAEYPRSWVMDRHWFLSEQYLLQAFLAFNRRVEVLWAGSCMHLNHPDLLEKAFRAYDRQREWPGSFWMRMT